jgi:predicted transposase/invertase (TIGR01784 family)
MTTNAPPHNPHDNSYKSLFSHPEMVHDLIVGFLPAEWVQDFDMSTLERKNGNYVTDDLRERENDIIWRVRFKGKWLYLYILLEFQSSVDRFMAVRLLTYMGLLYQDLIKTQQFTDDGLLPPILPIVLYNGESRWTAAQSLQALVAQPTNGLQRYLPQLEYVLAG